MHSGQSFEVIREIVTIRVILDFGKLMPRLKLEYFTQMVNPANKTNLYGYLSILIQEDHFIFSSVFHEFRTQ